MSNQESSAQATSSTDAKMADTDIEGPKPSHYLARGGDKFTPLIPVDELPSDVTIVGVRAYINQEELLLLRGNALFPVVEKSAFNYAVEVGSPGATPQGAKPTRAKTTGANEPADPPASPPSHERHVNVPNTETRDARIEEALKLARQRKSAMKGASGNQVYNPTTPGVLGTKVYCTHWMRTGECDFTQQGCMFLHVMPDLDTLELLGFRSYPRWFREMPREWQMQNCKTFDEAGLDPHRHRGPQGYSGSGPQMSGGTFGPRGGFGGGPPRGGPGYYGGNSGFGPSPGSQFGSAPPPNYGRGWGMPPPPLPPIGPYGPPPPPPPPGPHGQFGFSSGASDMSMSSMPGSPAPVKTEPGYGTQGTHTGFSSPVPSVTDWKAMTPHREPTTPVQGQPRPMFGGPSFGGPSFSGPSYGGPGFGPAGPLGPSSMGPPSAGSPPMGVPPAPTSPDIIHPKRFTDPKFARPQATPPDGGVGRKDNRGGRRGKAHGGSYAEVLGGNSRGRSSNVKSAEDSDGPDIVLDTD